MASRLKKYYGHILRNITIQSAGAEGNCVARWDNLVVFVPYAAPGDVADIRVVGAKKKFLIGEILTLHTPSPDRIKPVCSHFGLCGGCKWQHVEYASQLVWKQQVVLDAFTRLHKVQIPTISTISGSDNIWHYRNKLEYSFSLCRWVLPGEPEAADRRAAGFHIPGRFDRILDINTCYLQHDLNNKIRLFIKNMAMELGLSFYHPKEQVGYMRNVIIRNNASGDWMVILIIGEEDTAPAIQILDALCAAIPEIKSSFWVVNSKMNDTIYDLETHQHQGTAYITENIDNLTFRVRPKSFFQPNGQQAGKLYHFALTMADIQPSDVVYDLYCGTGTLSLRAAKYANQVVGIESVPQAIDDAKENAELNGIYNCNFVVGDMRFIFNDTLLKAYGNPNVVITDPPRGGMHEDVIAQLLAINPDKIVYVSCNPATQARDIQLMEEQYEVITIQPVDMFPHTHHVENVVLLRRR